MGKLIDGVWHDIWYETNSNAGRFIREDASFRHLITPQSFVAPEDGKVFTAEANRYHLYVSYACPWAHRTLIFRKLKGLEKLISISIVHYFMGSSGWTFEMGPGVIPDSETGAQFLHEIYTKANPNYSGRVTVPVLWDKHLKTIVNNESSEIIRMFNSAFDELGAIPGDYYPVDLAEEIDTMNAKIYHHINNGVYRCGFATTQEAYSEALRGLFATLEWLEDRLKSQRYLCGDRLTEADWRLFTTLIRFDAVYVGHFKTNLKCLREYPNLFAYTRDLYQMPGIAETINMHHIKNHYYESHTAINPTQIVPQGPMINFEQPHSREALMSSRQ